MHGVEFLACGAQLTSFPSSTMSDLSRFPSNITTTSSHSSYSNSTNNTSPVPPPPPPPPLQQQSSQKYSHRAANALARFAQPFLTASRPPSPQTSSPASRTDLSSGSHRARSKSLYYLLPVHCFLLLSLCLKVIDWLAIPFI